MLLGVHSIVGLRLTSKLELFTKTHSPFEGVNAEGGNGFWFEPREYVISMVGICDGLVTTGE